MKYLIIILLLFIFSTEKKLRNRCYFTGEKCKKTSQCCGARVCLTKKGFMCGPALYVGGQCTEDSECRSPNFCYESVCTAPFESKHRCLKNFHCQSERCLGNWGGYKWGNCE